MPTATVLIADDHTLLAEAFRAILEPHCKVIGIVADGRRLLDEAERLKPDIIIADIGMPLLNGLEAGRRLREKLPAMKLIFLTMMEDVELAIEAIRCKASAYLLKTSPSAELLRAVDAVIKGEIYITPRIARSMEEAGDANALAESAVNQLSERQREVVELISEGKSMKEVADILDVTPRTVAFHKYRIMRQLNISSTAQLIQFGIKSRLVV